MEIICLGIPDRRTGLRHRTHASLYARWTVCGVCGQFEVILADRWQVSPRSYIGN